MTIRDNSNYQLPEWGKSSPTLGRNGATQPILAAFATGLADSPCALRYMKIMMFSWSWNGALKGAIPGAKGKVDRMEVTASFLSWQHSGHVRLPQVFRPKM